MEVAVYYYSVGITSKEPALIKDAIQRQLI